MVKSIRYGTAFLTEAQGAGRGMYDVDQHLPGSWAVMDTMQAEKLFKARQQGFNTPTKLVFAALAKAGVRPEMHLLGSPHFDTEGQIVQEIKRPKSLASFAQAAKEATMEGKPPNSFKVYISGISPEALKQLVIHAHKAWAAYKAGEQNFTLDGIQRVLDLYVKKEMRKRVITGWIEILIETEGGARPNPSVHTKFSYAQIGYNVTGHAAGLADQAPDQDKLKWLTTKRKDLETDVSLVSKLYDAVLSLYYYEIWKAFKEYVYDDPKGVVHTIDEELKRGEVRLAYDKKKGKPVPTSATKGKEQYDPNKPHKNPVLYDKARGINYHPINQGRAKKLVYGHEGWITSTHPRGPKSRVVASIRQAGGDLGTMIVTANDKERVHQNAQGVFSRPDPPPSNLGAMVPESPVASIVDTEDYHAIFGIYYDHPLIIPKLSRQVYWYGQRDHFFRAVFEYATMTGDRPHLAYRIFPKKGDRANVAITRQELEQDVSPGGRRAVAAINKTITAFNREVERGKRLWPAKIAKWLGTEVDLTQDDIPVNPLRDIPTGDDGKPLVDPEGWAKYRTWVRNQSRSKLGLNFQAQLSKRYIDAQRSQKQAWQYSRHDDRARQNLKKSIRMTGERDKRGKPIEPWGVYLIEYILGHKAVGMVGETYMIPINIIRADEDIEPRGTTKRWTKSKYMNLLREHFGRYPVAKATNWKYLNARVDHSFPFSRLIRHSVALEKDLPVINERLKGTGIKRTVFGYEIEGIEWDAYQMVVAMPPSVAEKEFGMIHRKAYSRLLIDEPRIVNRVRMGKQGIRKSLRGFALTPFSVKTEFPAGPWSKADPTHINPLDVVGRQTNLPPGYFHSKIGQRWVPKVHEHLNDAAEIAHRSVVGFETENDADERMKMWETYARRVTLKAKEVEYDIRNYLRAMQKVRLEKGSSLGKDLERNLSTYIRYVGKETTPTGGQYQIPVVMNKIGLATYQAPVGSMRLRTTWLSIKAPSESVAQLMILYRLLRRSVKNKEMGKAMKIRSKGGSYRIFPDNNARLLAQWAKSNFLVVREDDPKGTQRIGPRRHLAPDELERGVPDSQHLLARLLRID